MRRGTNAPVAEHWHCDAGSAPVAVLQIPASLSRPRTFDVDVTLLVRVPDGDEPWHQLNVELDGQQQWQRRIPSHAPSDGLDYHCRIRLEPGHALRIRAVAAVGACSVQQLGIEAREEL